MFLKNLYFLPYCLCRKVFTRFQVCGFSSSSSSPDVSVWWHLDSCPVPSGVSFSKVAPSIMAAVRANGIMGTIHIRAYGDFNSSEVDKEALNSTNISLYSITDSSFIKPKINTDRKNNTYKHFLMDLNDWISTNPPPVHLFLIFGYRDFSSNGILPRLRMSNYNILLACPGRPHVALCHAATIIWDWSSLLKGEDLTGKHFNYPPDGPSNSWYGNSIVPLENPFLVAQELHKSSQNAEIYKPSLDDIKLGEVSKSVSRQVMKILCSHSIGISMGDLRAELTKCDLPLVKRFYGHKKFSNFLVSIPHVQLEYLGEGDFWVRLVPSTTSAVKNKQHDGATTQKLHNEGSEGDDLKSFQSIPSQGKPIGENAENKHEFPTEVDEVCRNPFTSSLFSWISSFWTFSKSNAESQVDQSASHFEEPKSSDISFRVSVSVWWDFETCGIPSDISFFNVAPSIMGVLRANGIQGPIRIDAYGDVSQFSKIKQEALFLSGIDLHHIPGGKNMNICFMDWLSQNPSNRHLFLISGDEDFDFSGTLHRIWWRSNNNVLLACPGKADRYVCKAATIVWQWSSVLNGKYLTGIYFKQPPYFYLKARAQVPLEYPPEWYRNSKMPHENPFSDVEELTSSQNAEIHEPSSYIKSFKVKKWISRKVREVLSSYPNGISIGDLNFQLRLVSRGEVQSINGADDAVERVVKGREERGEVDRESDGELGNEERDVTVEIDMIGTGFKRKRPRSKVERNSVQKPKKYWPVEPSENLKEKQDPEVIHEEVPENIHLEEVFLKDFLEKKPKLKSPAKRRPKHIEMPLQNLPEVEKHHDNEKPKLPEPASVGNITNNSREENEEMLTLKLQELAIEIQEISAESADCKEANTENIEDYRTEFTRRQGDKLIARLGNFSNTLKQLCDLLQECK